MNIAIGTQISYTSAAGTRVARVANILIANAADNRPQTWMDLEIDGSCSRVRIPCDRGSLAMFRVEVLPGAVVPA